MNNERGCAHGRQRGKCADCDLAQAESELAGANAVIKVLRAQIETMLQERLTPAAFMRLTEWLQGNPIRPACASFPLGWERQLAIALEAGVLGTIHKERARADAWKANHDNQVERARVLLERIDMPFERVAAYKKYSEYKRDHIRYKYIRGLSLAGAAMLYNRVNSGVDFDYLIDSIAKP